MMTAVSLHGPWSICCSLLVPHRFDSIHSRALYLQLNVWLMRSFLTILSHNIQVPGGFVVDWTLTLTDVAILQHEKSFVAVFRHFVWINLFFFINITNWVVQPWYNFRCHHLRAGPSTLIAMKNWICIVPRQAFAKIMSLGDAWAITLIGPDLKGIAFRPTVLRWSLTSVPFDNLLLLLGLIGIKQLLLRRIYLRNSSTIAILKQLWRLFLMVFFYIFIILMKRLYSLLNYRLGCFWLRRFSVTVVLRYFAFFTPVTGQFKMVLGMCDFCLLIHHYHALVAWAMNGWYFNAASREIFLVADPTFVQHAKVFWEYKLTTTYHFNRILLSQGCLKNETERFLRRMTYRGGRKLAAGHSSENSLCLVGPY